MVCHFWVFKDTMGQIKDILYAKNGWRKKELYCSQVNKRGRARALLHSNSAIKKTTKQQQY